jgi:hypothetical protein
MNEQQQIRDAVIKLEVKMEAMSDSMVSMADAITKLSDMRFEMLGVRKDVSTLVSKIDKHEQHIQMLEKKHLVLEKAQAQNTYVISKIEIFWAALIAGAGSFLWWLAKG